MVAGRTIQVIAAGYPNDRLDVLPPWNYPIMALPSETPDEMGSLVDITCLLNLLSVP